MESSAGPPAGAVQVVAIGPREGQGQMTESTHDQARRIRRQARRTGIVTAIRLDNGKTVVHSGTVRVVGVYNGDAPAEYILDDLICADLDDVERNRKVDS